MMKQMGLNIQPHFFAVSRTLVRFQYRNGYAGYQG